MKKKLLHIIDSLGPGGAERLVVDVICNLPHYEHHLIILNEPEDLRAELPPDCYYTNLKRKSNKEIFQHARTIKRYIEVNGIDLVHAHLFFSSVIARLATSKKIPLFNSIHIISSLDNYSKSKLALYLEKLTYRKHHHIIAVSKEALNDFDKWVGIKGSSTVLYNFIRDEFFQPSIAQKSFGQSLRLVAVGNLRYQKNYPYLLEAFKTMPANVSLDIYGIGYLHDSLKKEIEASNLPVRLMGGAKQLHKILPTYDAYVMSSFFEGQPLSLLEAIACGLPAILSDTPVLREVTGEDALYFDLNDPKDFVSKIEQVLRGEIDITKNMVSAFNRIKTFARKETYLKSLTSLYQSKMKPEEVSLV